MREGDEIDREAWAKLLESLLLAANLTPETASQPVGPIPVGWRTVRRWLAKDSGVSARNIRDVCRALEYPTTRALVEVGFLEYREAGVTGLAAPPSAATDPLVRKIAASLADSRIPAEVRAVLRRLLQGAYDAWIELHKARTPRDAVDTSSRPSRAK